MAYQLILQICVLFFAKLEEFFRHFFIEYISISVMDSMFVPSQNSNVETLTPNVIVFEHGAFEC